MPDIEKEIIKSVLDLAKILNTFLQQVELDQRMTILHQSLSKALIKNILIVLKH